MISDGDGAPLSDTPRPDPPVPVGTAFHKSAPLSCQSQQRSASQAQALLREVGLEGCPQLKRAEPCSHEKPGLRAARSPNLGSPGACPRAGECPGPAGSRRGNLVSCQGVN